MDVAADLIMKGVENYLPKAEEEKTRAAHAYTVAVCGPEPFVSGVDAGLKNSFLPAKTVPFTKSDRETAESISALRPEAVLLDSAYASEGMVRTLKKSGIDVVKMDRGWKKVEEFRTEIKREQPQPQRARFINFLYAYSAVCLVWEI